MSLVNKTGETLSSIGGQVRVISEHFGVISMAAREQATGISEINAAIGSMDQITQQNAAMVEQTNAATQNLLGINQTLGQLVSRFSLSGGSSRRCNSGEPPGRHDPRASCVQAERLTQTRCSRSKILERP